MDINGTTPMKPTSGGGGAAAAVVEDPPGVMRDPALQPRKWNTDIPNILPHERVFPIQIGTEMFRLSGASISSDAPSYFSQFFKCQLESAKENGGDTNSIRTLYIDRDPLTFRDISLHLQGYHVAPRDGSHFVKLFADAQFYCLPRLISQLYEENIFISIGHRDFQVPRELFSDPGNSPNYFSLGFTVFFSTPSKVFPGLDREGLLRPPSILPPSVPNRSADTFAELLHLLRGYPLHIKNEDHREELLRDARYFHLKGLEQKLLRHTISYNLSRQKSEITLQLSDIRQSGISIHTSPHAAVPASTNPAAAAAAPEIIGYIHYARPFIDPIPYELILEIGDECTAIHRNLQRAEFFNEGKSRVSRLFEVVAAKLNLPSTQPLGLLMAKGGASSQPASPGNSGVSEDLVRVEVGAGTEVWLDGRAWFAPPASGNGNANANGLEEDDEVVDERARKRRRTDVSGAGVGTVGGETWIVKTGQWRLRVQRSGSGNGRGGLECVLEAVKLDAVSGERGRNSQRRFLA